MPAPWRNSASSHGWPGHSLKDVGCIVAGKCGGRSPKPGRQIRYRDGTPLSNPCLTRAERTSVNDLRPWLVGIERKNPATLNLG